MIEEFSRQGAPLIVVDPRGAFGGYLLLFPDLPGFFEQLRAVAGGDAGADASRGAETPDAETSAAARTSEANTAAPAGAAAVLSGNAAQEAARAADKAEVADDFLSKWCTARRENRVAELK
ncbi:MAG: hypothetical protein JSW67_01560 [Candidatus Latescibacterota bacterium]|nr:MAG: hypothetical protein JSW67_01560 [Candidatus Latescibacterota bacterium]